MDACGLLQEDWQYDYLVLLPEEGFDNISFNLVQLPNKIGATYALQSHWIDSWHEVAIRLRG